MINKEFFEQLNKDYLKVVNTLVEAKAIKEEEIVIIQSLESK